MGINFGKQRSILSGFEPESAAADMNPVLDSKVQKKGLPIEDLRSEIGI
jgi:hypothetical protein